MVYPIRLIDYETEEGHKFLDDLEKNITELFGNITSN